MRSLAYAAPLLRLSITMKLQYLLSLHKRLKWGSAMLVDLHTVRYRHPVYMEVLLLLGRGRSRATVP